MGWTNVTLSEKVKPAFAECQLWDDGGRADQNSVIPQYQVGAKMPMKRAKEKSVGLLGMLSIFVGDAFLGVKYVQNSWQQREVQEE